MFTIRSYKSSSSPKAFCTSTMDSCGKQTNVLLVTLAAHGHLNPILTLGKLLVSKGLNVTLATTHRILKTTGNSISGVHLEFFSDGVPADLNKKPDVDHYMDTINKFGPINLLALVRSHRSKFSCIITTPFTPWVAGVAEEIGVPIAMLWIQPCALYQIYHRYYNRLDEFPTGDDFNSTVKLPGLPEFTSDELPSFVLPTNRWRSFDSILNEVFHSMHKVKWVLGNSFMELEKDVILSVNDAGGDFRPVGPLVPAKLLNDEEDEDEDDGESDYCINWLDKQKPSSVVYISFGTVLSSSEKELHSIASGLRTTNRPFLWVVRSPENQENQELGFLKEIKEQGLIVSWCPQAKVLSHGSIGCFLSHCGWNSLLESVAAGVPVVAYPQWSDQPANAKLVVDVWGVGVRVRRSEGEGGVSAEEVGRCVEEVMGGRRSEEYRRKALGLKTAARKAVADGGSSEKNIELFVNEIISSCSSYSERK